MSKHYQLRRTGYAIPHNIYMQVKYIVLDYPQMCRERGALAVPEAPDDEHFTMLDSRIAAVEEAARHVGDAYSLCIRRDDVAEFDALRAFGAEDGLAYFQYALYHPEKEREPSYMTWRRCRQMLIYLVAKNLNLI